MTPLKRALLAVAFAATFGMPAMPAFADHCGDDTLQQPCETCVVVWTDATTFCVPLDPHLIGG